MIQGLRQCRIQVRPASRIARIVAFLSALGLSGPAAAQAPFPDPPIDAPLAKSPAEQSAVFAGGCFWGVQAVFEHVRGVKSAVAGYSGGSASEANYAAVSRGTTGHAESVSVIFDPSQITYGTLLKIFFSIAHDPTERNRQGPDVGSQYRSEIFYTDARQREIADAYVTALNRQKRYPNPVVTRIEPLANFHPAENYHQDYVAHHPDALYVVINDLPKLRRLQAEFPSLYRTAN